MENPVDTQNGAFELGLNAELMALAVVDGEWLDAAEKLKVYKESAMLLSDICTLTRQFNKSDRLFAEELRRLGLRQQNWIYCLTKQSDNEDHRRSMRLTA